MPDYLKRKTDFSKPETAALFDELAFWMLRFGHLLLQHLEITANREILDIGCGTGFPLLELARLHGPGSRVVGVDIWTAALDRARTKLRMDPLAGVKIVEADAARMPFADSEFNLVVSNLGLNNFEQPEKVLRECFRVTRPGGTLALTTNVRGHMREFYSAFRAALRAQRRTAALERLRQNEEHRGSKQSISRLLTAAGFQVTKAVDDRFTLRFANAAAFFNHPLIQLGFMDAWRAVAGPKDEREIFAALAQRLDNVAKRRGTIELTIPMLYLEATKP